MDRPGWFHGAPFHHSDGRGSAFEADSSVVRALGSIVGIAAIVVLGSVFWIALAALGDGLNNVSQALSDANPTHYIYNVPQTTTPAAATGTPLAGAVAASPTSAAATAMTDAAATAAAAAPTPALLVNVDPLATPASVDATPTPASAPTPVPTPQTASTTTGGRAPWILLPSPDPGTTVPAGSVSLEARGRGDAPISSMSLQVDGAMVPSSMDQRSDSIWRVQASINLRAGHHTIQAAVVDNQGRTGSYRWSFDVAS